MGYETYFSGTVKIEPQLTDEMKEYLNKFAEVRHMKRDVSKLEEQNREIIGEGTQGPKAYLYHNCLDNQFGIEGEFYVGSDEKCGVLNYNEPPSTQPGLWCQWIVNDNGELEWDENEKFYNGGEWMKYIVNKILAPRGYVCNGEIFADGESSDDFWKIVVKDNEVEIIDGFVIYNDDPRLKVSKFEPIEPF